MPCKLCVERGKPAHFGSEPKCCWPEGRPDEPFTFDNWACATALLLRTLAGEGEYMEPNERRMYLRWDDQSYAGLFVPSHPAKPEDEGEWRGGGMLAMTWYKSRGQTEVMVRVNGYNASEGKAATPATLAEAEEAVAILSLAEMAS